MSAVQTIAIERTGLPENASCLIVWGHGWGQNRNAFRPLAETLASRAIHLLIDFPGFGDSPAPPTPWGTADYADVCAEIIRPYRGIKKIIWVGHSFGGRVGIQLAARHPELVDGLCLIAAAGLQRQRSFLRRLQLNVRIYLFKALKHIAPYLGLRVDRLRALFGSADYQSAGPMRSIFVKIVQEDLSEQARCIQCPAQLIYGANDTETPPEIGVRLKNLIPNANLTVLSGQDHYSVLGAGRHIVIKRLADFMEKLSS